MKATKVNFPRFLSKTKMRNFITEKEHVGLNPQTNPAILYNNKADYFTLLIRYLYSKFSK